MFQETIDSLYEDNRQKAQGIKDLLTVLKTKQIIVDASKDSALINAMTRVLKEEFKKDYDLTFNLLSVFKIFSMFSELQFVVSENKIGDVTLRILEQELTRMEKIKVIPKEPKIEQLERKITKVVDVSLQILYDLSCNLNLEVKMISRDLLKALKYFSNGNGCLPIVTRWLIKLSLVKDNHEEIISWDMKFSSFLNSTNESEVIDTLMLLNNLYLSNLSRFEPLLPQIKNLYTIGRKSVVDAINGIIYNLFLAKNEKLHSQFHSIIIGKHLVEKQVADEYSKINLQIAIKHCSSDVVLKNSKYLIDYCEKAMRSTDDFQWVSLINLSENPEIAKQLITSIPTLISLLQRHSNSSMGVCITSVLSNLSYHEPNISKLVKSYQLYILFPSILDKCLNDDLVSDGIKAYTVAIVSWIAALSRDVKVAELFSKSNIHFQLIMLFQCFNNNHELTILSHALFQFLMVPGIRQAIISDESFFRLT
eukprot:NODE_642_length_5641_cov_0.441898.p1 type:complete len:479 gc:universal NODE_642_length_5641_cov_0.441898:657-2093(+)